MHAVRTQDANCSVFQKQDRRLYHPTQRPTFCPLRGQILLEKYRQAVESGGQAEIITIADLELRQNKLVNE